MGLDITQYIPDTVIAWVEFRDGAKFKLRYSGTDEPEAALVDRAQNMQLTGADSTKDKLSMMMEHYAEDIVMDWEGLTDDQGKEFKYSKENALYLLRKAKNIRDFVQTESSNIKNFKEDKDLKNSESGEKKG